ncbi:MAG: ligase-associated DNA damage response DEXH box helicase [Bacteroidia bacterium]
MNKAFYQWFKEKNIKPFLFQEQAWEAFLNCKSGLINAPTGSGKTYSLALPLLANGINKSTKGLQAIWITPIRALTKDLVKAIETAAIGINSKYTIGYRTGDTTQKERAKQNENLPNILITTPESLHVLLSTKDYEKKFSQIKAIVVDEWHEMLGNKRGVQTELALSRLKGLNPNLQIWGISATIGNLQQAMQVLLGSNHQNGILIKAEIEKKIEIKSIYPTKAERLPWAGHLGIKLAEQIVPLIDKAKTTLIFTNTRAQTEIWYRQLLEIKPDWAGLIAMHHGSLSNEIRQWVEDALHTGILKAVVCTSSLDLGVDFRPVEQIIQIGGPKGIARFMQRAGRSGHAPGQVSVIYFLPTHALELTEASALKLAVKQNIMENREPLVRCFDVLIQYLCTLATGQGFYPKQIYNEIKQTHCFNTISELEWQWVLFFITQGSQSLNAYNEFKKVEVDEKGIYKITNKGIAMRHRLSIGTIVSDAAITVKYANGGFIGTVEEWFISRLNIGDVFWFAGKNLELVQVKNLTAYVKKSEQTKGQIPSWQGGRMPLTSKMSEVLRHELHSFAMNQNQSKDLKEIAETLNFQKERSVIPLQNQLLIETLESKEGHHAFIYPFEGRLVHEALASLIAYRISQQYPITFSMAFNDYGFELLSDIPFDMEEAIGFNIFGVEDLSNHLLNSINAAELAQRKFREIARIAGLVFTGFPGKMIKTKHLQANSSLFFKVFSENEPDNLLIQQAYEELLLSQFEETRLRMALIRIAKIEIIIKKLEKPGPFAFPIMVDRLREKLSSEKLEDRIKKMQVAFS